MKGRPVRLHILPLAVIATAIALAPRALAQSAVVVGTGNPDVDIPAVQAAVDRGGTVVLKGHFSFNRSPTIPTALAAAGYPPATVLVSRAVTISGVRSEGVEGDDMTSIAGGTIPFYVAAPGASVKIERLRFVGPTFEAVLVYAVNGLTIASCKIQDIADAPTKPGKVGIDIDTTGLMIPNPTQPGHPENISGTLSIADNDIDVSGGTSLELTLGITVFSVGQSPDGEVDLRVSGNHISNTTEPAINLRRVAGQVRIEDNVLATGPISSEIALRPEVIRAVNIGSYLIAHNSIVCQWPDPEAIGIGVFSQFAAWPMTRAVVLDNDVVMSPPADTMFGDLSAAIEIRGFAQNNVVAYNRIRGRARAALAVDVFKGGIPADNVFALNRLDHFEAATADVFIGQGVTNTLVLGQTGTIRDLGLNTVVVPF
jgi:hypothetical protein